MSIAASVVTAGVAVLHVWIVILEMFLWTHPIGRKTFGTKKEVAESSKVLAANQGLYNGFLAAGLFWGLWRAQGAGPQDVVAFFLGCVFIAGLYGGATANPRIVLVQSVPAALGLGLWLAAS